MCRSYLFCCIHSFKPFPRKFFPLITSVLKTGNRTLYRSEICAAKRAKLKDFIRCQVRFKFWKICKLQKTNTFSFRRNWHAIIKYNNRGWRLILHSCCCYPSCFYPSFSAYNLWGRLTRLTEVWILLFSSFFFCNRTLIRFPSFLFWSRTLFQFVFIYLTHVSVTPLAFSA